MRHAYLIIAHNQFDLLKIEMELLDHPTNDLFIHIDKKAKGFNKNDFSGICKHSKVCFIPRRRIYWGGLSQVKVEFDLLEAALPGGYEYYHLLSGVDLPIKTPEYIYSYFEIHNGYSSIGFCEEHEYDSERVKHFHIFPWLSRGRYKVISKLSNYFQRILHINRMKSIRLGKGPNWFSITKELADLVISKKRWVLKHFRFCLGADEFFLQTLVVNSRFASKIISKVRLTDWERGTPYTYRDSDIDELMSSDKLFARKFDIERFPGIVNAIYGQLKGGK